MRAMFTFPELQYSVLGVRYPVFLPFRQNLSPQFFYCAIRSVIDGLLTQP